MGLYTTLEDAGFTHIVQTETMVPWERALRNAANKQPIRTSARFYAKKAGKHFKIVIERLYRNRTSGELLSEQITSETEVTPDEYDRATAKAGPDYIPRRF
jgi:hypothetical protein